ncbi:HK97 gp10 family phage protein [uncultured Mitsuokella sp.]|uniref:HK97 gp10 family phage protein n=1 Tax=uncultured Mitsuokella sp. TaxID=453120 RepID=UPI002593A429|nr:HK97 gp10 family phage protein [uncultured Mitsuokella sp.]
MGFEFSGLDELIQRLDEASKKVPDARDKFLAQEAELVRGDAVSLSPVDTGNLREAWKRSTPDNGRVDVYNNTEYAAHVEYGHRQKVGQYVPAIGKRLKKPFVEGKHMLRDAVQQRQDIFAEDAEEILKGLMP